MYLISIRFCKQRELSAIPTNITPCNDIRWLRDELQKRKQKQQEQVCGLTMALKQMYNLSSSSVHAETPFFIWKSDFTRWHFIRVKNNLWFKLQKSTKRSLITEYLLLLPPVLRGGFGVRVDTIWQCTVPRSSISHTGPITSVRGMLCGLEAEQNNTIAATTKRERKYVLL